MKNNKRKLDDDAAITRTKTLLHFGTFSSDENYFIFSPKKGDEIKCTNFDKLLLTAYRIYVL